jgi:hypothetical protein
MVFSIAVNKYKKHNHQIPFGTDKKRAALQQLFNNVYHLC